MMLLEMGGHFLTPWEKIGIIFLGGAVVSVTILLVTCYIFPNCIIYKALHAEEIERDKNQRRHQKQIGDPRFGTTRFSSDCEASEKSRINRSRSKSAESLLTVRQKKLSIGAKNNNGSFYGSSGRHSPGSMSSISGAMTNIFSSTSSFSLVDQPPQKEKPMSIKLAFKLERLTQEKAFEEESDPGKKFTLDVTLIEVNGVPRRSYSFVRDCYAMITVYSEKTSLTTRKLRTVLSESKTKVVRNSLDPKFNFTTLLPMESPDDLKGMKVRFAILDHDKHIKTSTIGNAIVEMKHLKALLVSPDELKMEVSTKASKKQDIGSIEIGLSYLPTAQRISFNINKAVNLNFESADLTLDSFNPFVRVMQLSQSGKVLRKKKTRISTEPSSTNPVYDETINFELPPSQVEQMTFVLMVSSQSCSRDNEHISEKCLGSVSLGKNVTGEKERAQWFTIMTSPRTVFTSTFKLE